MTPSLDEFLRRFLLHLLPDSLVRIRNFGFLASRRRATALPSPGDAWSATPFPSSILLYTEGQGLPKDRSQAKADEYFRNVVAKEKALVLDTLEKLMRQDSNRLRLDELS
jgi:Putative transposase